MEKLRKKILIKLVVNVVAIVALLVLLLVGEEKDYSTHNIYLCVRMTLSISLKIRKRFSLIPFKTVGANAGFERMLLKFASKSFAPISMVISSASEIDLRRLAY